MLDAAKSRRKQIRDQLAAIGAAATARGGNVLASEQRQLRQLMDEETATSETIGDYKERVRREKVAAASNVGHGKLSRGADTVYSPTRPRSSSADSMIVICTKALPGCGSCPKSCPAP